MDTSYVCPRRVLGDYFIYCHSQCDYRKCINCAPLVNLIYFMWRIPHSYDNSCDTMWRTIAIYGHGRHCPVQLIE